jgi:hypothetical protein
MEGDDLDSYLIGILGLAVTAIALYFGIELYDRWRDRNRKSDHAQQKLFHRDR